MAAILAPARTGFNPTIPQTFEELGISQSLVLDLVLRRLLLEGFSNLQGLSASLRLSIPILNIIFNHMRQQQLVEVKGMVGNDYHFTLSQSGKLLASERFQITQYAGAAPVSLKDYHSATKSQTAQVRIDRKALRSAFSDLVIHDQLLDQLGPALISQNSIFIYGPTGNGKTSLAERMLRVYQDAVLMPYSVEVDGQIITIYDPAVHVRVPDEEPEGCDKRWVVCCRPAVLVGGELTVEMLDLQFNPNTKYYVGPAQMKANNGVLIIDDFGRQRVHPDVLLNRWVVPLDRGIDFLTLAGGQKIEVPFEALVVFATNMDPAQLIDAAFLRRIQTKIKLGEVSNEHFCEIFRRVAGENHLSYEAGMPGELIDYIHNALKQELRSCYPRDIVNQVCWAARYEGRRPFLDRASLKQAIEAYFLTKF